MTVSCFSQKNGTTVKGKCLESRCTASLRMHSTYTNLHKDSLRLIAHDFDRQQSLNWSRLVQRSATLGSPPSCTVSEVHISTRKKDSRAAWWSQHFIIPASSQWTDRAKYSPGRFTIRGTATLISLLWNCLDERTHETAKNSAVFLRQLSLLGDLVSKKYSFTRENLSAHLQL